MAQPAALEPLAQGSLSDTPFAHLLVYFEQRASTGTLVVSPASAEQDGLRYGIRIRDGRVVGAMIDDGGMGIEQALLPLCALTDGVFAFYADDLLPNDASVLQGTLDPYRFLSASLARYARQDLVDRVLERYAGVRMRLQPGRDLERLKLDVEQRALLDLLRADPATPEALEANAPMSREGARRTLYLLIVTRTVEPFDEQQPATPRRRPHSRVMSVPIAAEASPSPSPSPTSSSAVRRVNSIPAPEGRASIGPPAGRSSLGPPARATSSSPPAAWKVLAARQATSLAPGAPVDDAAAELKRIEKLVRNSDLVAADRALDALLAQEKDHPRGMATKAWILLLKAQKAHTKVPREVLDMAKRVLAESPDEARALLVRGLYYKNEDKLQNALACFRKASKADPMDIDAKREAHLLARQLGVAD